MTAFVVMLDVGAEGGRRATFYLTAKRHEQGWNLWTTRAADAHRHACEADALAARLDIVLASLRESAKIRHLDDEEASAPTTTQRSEIRADPFEGPDEEPPAARDSP